MMPEDTSLDDLVDRAVLVVAHPDDEVLWFGSVVSRVEELIVCFEESDPSSAGAATTMGERRRRVAQAFPRTADWLRFPEPGTFGRIPWEEPRYTEFGVAARDEDTNARIAQRFAEVRDTLERKLRGARIVFTHNPWGEYGHADHSLVHAAVWAAVDSRAVRVICPLVTSVTSVRAMRGYRGSGWGSSISGAVDVEFCTAVRDLYLRHGAWTWDRGWRFPTEERFAELLPGCDDPVKCETLSWVVGPEDHRFSTDEDEQLLKAVDAHPNPMLV